MRQDEEVPHPDDLTDNQFEVIAEMAENNGYSVLGIAEAKQELEKMGLLQRRKGGGWQFTARGNKLAEVYRHEAKSRNLRKRN